MDFQANTIRVLGSAVVAAIVAFAFVVLTGWGIDNGWSIFLVALVIFVILTGVLGYYEGRF